jgi:hypothetical protein
VTLYSPNRPPLALPDDMQVPPAVAPLFANYKRLVTESTTARGVLGRMQKELTQVEADARRASADALRAGNTDPGTKTLDKHRAELDKQRHKVASYDTAVALAYDDLVDAIKTHRRDWLDAARDDAQDAQNRYRAALDDLNAAHDDLELARSTVAWLALYDDAHRMFRKRQPQPALRRSLAALAALADEPLVDEPEVAPERERGYHHGEMRWITDDDIAAGNAGPNWPDRAA